jgi:hypothetical protein
MLMMILTTGGDDEDVGGGYGDGVPRGGRGQSMVAVMIALTMNLMTVIF